MSRIVLAFLSLLVMGLLTGAEAQEGKALVGGRLIDGFGHTPIQNSVILIEGDTITEVGTVDTLPVPDGYEVISTEGMDVLPGLWESHAHLMLTGHSDYPYWHTEYADRFATEIMPASASHLLLAGITSVRDLGAPLEASKSLLERVNAGEIPGPRLYMSGPFLQADIADWQKGYRWPVKNVSDARAKVQQLDEAGMVIGDIDSDSPLRETGVQPGMAILSAGGVGLNSVSDLETAIAETRAKGRDKLLLAVRNGQRTLFVTVDISEQSEG